MTIPLPESTTLSQVHWNALSEGRLTYQCCECCGHKWLPAREECPECLAADWKWQDASGTGKIISWVVYHHSFHAEFVSRVPYIVILVELAEGPRLMSGLIGSYEDLSVDEIVTLKIEEVDGVALPKFCRESIAG